MALKQRSVVTGLRGRLTVLIDRYIHCIVILLLSAGFFVLIMASNPQTLARLGWVQLSCDLPEHSKCVAEPLFSSQ